MDLRIYLLSIVFYSFTLSAWSQDSLPESDPLRKPRIWRQLVKTPEKVQLWEAYFQKGVFDMSKEENEMMQKLQTYLADRVANDYEQRKKAKEKQSRKILFTKRYEELVRNPVRNFLMLEKYLDERFKSLGKDYRYYSELHPKGKHPKVLWIEENEEKLRRIFRSQNNK